MAGEIEEPFSLSFQADSIHNGSISFGRFETECLSWERRSSFSHNRYLEEVEKYSRPGSVTEKKAYFEAHFKRKALLSRSSSDSQNGIQSQTSENDTSENTDYKDEFEHTNEGGYSVQFDESFDGSEYDGDCDLMECVRGDLRTTCVEPQFQTDLNNVNEAEQVVPEHVNPDEAYQTGAGSLPAIDAEQRKEVIENLNDKSANVGLTCKPVHLSTNCHSTGKDDSVNLEHRQESCPKVGTKLESKLAKPRLKSSTQVQRNVSSEPSKCSAKKHIRSKSEDSQSKKTEKHSSHAAILTTRWVCRTSKPEDPKSSKSKVIHDNRSEKELKTKKVVHEPKPSASEKLVPKARQNANRPKQVENSTKSGMKQSLAVFNFKSDERAERRKEFYMKLGEKKHAKKAGTTQIQANKLEKTEADIKQFRKSLDLKETPKAVSSNTKSSKLQSKSSSPGCGAVISLKLQHRPTAVPSNNQRPSSTR